ncbi:MAG: Dam family site-specific DNA-(adenine-N6)-methyltransferase, partial [Methanobacterium paludis]|nr:Dam family site-specific DNA-(adenine-N6)-methyltransferase [Methanobacterium paludis]
MKNVYVSPVVKWVGGKRQLLNVINKYIPNDFNSYCEPFLGGGAVLFDLQPKKAVVNDLNSELMNVYKVIESDVEGLISDLKNHDNNADYFYEMRGKDRDKELYDTLSDIERASRILYLNKTCFNGLFRVNNAGEFNTPFG